MQKQNERQKLIMTTIKCKSVMCAGTEAKIDFDFKKETMGMKKVDCIWQQKAATLISL